MKEYKQNNFNLLPFLSKNNIFLLCFLISVSVFSQNSKEALERKKSQILKEIEVAERLLKTGKQKEQSVLNQIEQQVAKIRLRETLIETNVKKKELYEGEISKNERQLIVLNKELELLKIDYANVVLKSYKSRSSKSRIMFVLSSENFLQAYKRLEYMKQYANYRKDRGEEIKAITTRLMSLNNLISQQKQEKEVLIESNKIELQTFEKEKEEKTVLVSSLKQQQKKIEDEIRRKHKQSMQIEERIDQLIKESIIAANKKRAAEAAAAAAKARTTVAKTSTSSSTTIDLTPEAKTLSEGFRYNKGRLPWPVNKGLLTKRFGMQPHPIEKTILIESNGVEITTEENEMARAVFGGHVIDIQLMPNNTAIVMIRHGDYTTVYSNLINLRVRKGDRISMKDEIGEIYYNDLLKKAVLKFLIYKNSFKQDPQQWIYNM